MVSCFKGGFHTGFRAHHRINSPTTTRNGDTLSPSGLNALLGKENVCWCGKTIGKTNSYNSGGANRLNRMSLPFVRQLLGIGCPCVFVSVRHV